MPQNTGENSFRIITAQRISIRMANSARMHAYEHFARFWGANFDVTKLKWKASFKSNCGSRFHRAPQEFIFQQLRMSLIFQLVCSSKQGDKAISQLAWKDAPLTGRVR